MRVILSLGLRPVSAAIAGVAIAVTILPRSAADESSVNFAPGATTVRPSLNRRTQNSQTPTTTPVALTLGATLENQIEGTQTQLLTFSILAGECARIDFYWQGVDLDVGLRQTATGKILSVTRVRAVGSLPISIIDNQGGEYRLEVKPVESLKITGSYKVKLATLGPPSADDRKRVDAANLLVDAEREKSKEAATAKYLQAVALWRETGETYATANVLQLLARRYLSSESVGNGSQAPSKAEGFYQQAVEVSRGADPRQFAYLLLEIGSDYRRLDSPKKALSYYAEALQKFREIGDRRGEASTLYNQGFALARIGEDVVGALSLYNQALEIQRAEHDLLGEASTLNAMGGAYNKLGDQQQALRFYGQAAPVWKALHDPYREAVMINNVAMAYDDLSDWQQAKDGYEEALTILNLLVKEKGINCLEAPPASDPRVCGTLATVADNLGELDNSLGNPEVALKRFETSLPIREILKQPQGEGATLSRMCYSYLLDNKPAKALEFCERALPLNRRAEDLSKITSTLTFMGMAHAALLNQAKALDYYQQALGLRAKDGEQRSTAIVLDKIGLLYASMNNPNKAIESYGDALQLWRSLRDQDGETITLYNMARAESARGNVAAAHDDVERAIRLVEMRRGALTSQRLRTTYFANKENYYELDIDLKMRLGASGSQNYVAQALDVNEQARARNLLDLLTEANIRLDKSDSAAGSANAELRDLLERQLTIGRKLGVKANALTTLLGGKHTKEQEAGIDKEIDELTSESDRIESQIRVTNPLYAEVTRPQPLRTKEIQQQLLDDETTLVSYALGEQRSFAWVVRPASIEVFELPARKVIEDATRRVYDLLTVENSEKQGESFAQRSVRVKRADAEYPEAAQALSNMVLGKVVPALKTKRLVVVADGALQLIPFAALPLPGSSAVAETTMLQAQSSRAAAVGVVPKSVTVGPKLLISEHEIISLPSASVLALQRRELANRKPAPLAVAVLADPVFDRQDSRVAKANGNGNQHRKDLAKTGPGATPLSKQNVPGAPPTSGSPAISMSANEQSPLASALRDIGLDPDGRLRRLQFSLREAKAILGAAPTNKSFSALDFKASRETAVSSELSKYQIVHFATHGVMDLEHPELSGIVLSMVDEKGQSVDGYLRLHEIYNLNLPAELVVLSGCQTGIGKQLKGEGLIALTRGFMYAGARSVVASLWKVNDAATSALMAEFYRQMFTNHLKPAAALRAAQMELRKEKRWQSPYYWAGFFLQGEWN